MSNNQSPYFKGALWLGLLVLIPITALMFASLRADSEAPRWVVITFQFHLSVPAQFLAELLLAFLRC